MQTPHLAARLLFASLVVLAGTVTHAQESESDEWRQWGGATTKFHF